MNWAFWALRPPATYHQRQLSTTPSTLETSSAVKILPCTILESRTCPEYAGLPHSKLLNLVWRLPLRNLYLVKKPWNDTVLVATKTFIDHVHTNYPLVNIIVAEDVAQELAAAFLDSTFPHTLFTGNVNEIVAKTDLIVSLGGDGTTLRAVSAFSNAAVPPVLSFALGTLGFLLPFDFSTFADTFKAVFELRSKAINRTRLECHVVRKSAFADENHSKPEDIPTLVKEYELAHYKQHHNSTMLHAMNDISLHRGLQPNLISLDIYIDSEFLTTTTADGIVFSTPTGSTAYSLSSGGSITHPLVPCILLTPVCPRLLLFRPLILPLTSHIMIKLSLSNRNSMIFMNIDGIPQPSLRPGDEIHVVNETGTIFIPGVHQPPQLLRTRRDFDEYIEPGRSGFYREPDTPLLRGIFCVAKTENDWTKGINELLGFNSSFGGTNKTKTKK